MTKNQMKKFAREAQEEGTWESIRFILRQGYRCLAHTENARYIEEGFAATKTELENLVISAQKYIRKIDEARTKHPEGKK